MESKHAQGMSESTSEKKLPFERGQTRNMALSSTVSIMSNRRALVSFIFVGTMFVVPCVAMSVANACQTIRQNACAWVRLFFGLLVLGPPCAMLAVHTHAPYLRRVTAYAIHNCLTCVFRAYQDFVGCFEAPGYNVTHWMWLIGKLADFILCIFAMWLAQSRVKAIATIARHFATINAVRVVLILMLVLVAVCCVPGLPFWLLVFGIIAVFVMMGVFFLVVLRYFCILYFTAMKVKSGPVPESRAATAELVAQTLRIDLLCIFTSMLLTFAMNCQSLAVTNWTQSMEYTKLALQIVDHSCNLLMALSLSGALTGALAAHSEKWNRDTQRLRRRRVMSMSFAAGEHDPQWTEKVVELAGRGFTLEKLLEFYETLGRDCMLHYDPRRSTTHDVVRQAIIPLSRGNRCALATLMMGGVHTQPKKMITHNWSNRFCHLVAAIVADAVDESEFSAIALMLADGTDEIKVWVKSMGVHKNTYWVCAFSVNQHCSICGGCPDGSRDTVTGELFADSPCPCDLPKMFNTTPPLRPDGRGIQCEMNKFDAMMNYLAAKDPEFQHVVAIDKTFTLFSRAWCIAEIATANEVGIRQFLKIDSVDTLNKHAGRLRALRIEDMESARPEDKVEILNSIADTDAFNHHLQHVLFTELLPDWGDMNSLETAVMIGHFQRWAELSSDFAQAPSDVMLREEGAVASPDVAAEPREEPTLLRLGPFYV